MSRRIAIRGAMLAGVAGHDDGPCDLVIENGLIASLSPYDPREVISADEIVEAENYNLLPGLTDVHTHLREPGFEWKETIASGLAAAAGGGFANVMCMANTKPVADNPPVIRFMLEQARKAMPNGPRLFPFGALTKGLEGRELSPLAELAEAGCMGFSNDGLPMPDTERLRRAMEYAADLGMRISDHAEDPTLAPGVGINEGLLSGRLGLKGQPVVGETIHIARDIMLAAYLDTPIHIAHVSCEAGVELIRQAKAKGIPVTAETCPHYLHFTEDACEAYNTLAKVSPPLRTENDRQALLEAIVDGTIDCLATDHAPHAAHEKEEPFEDAPNGISGLDTALSLTWTLVEQKLITCRDVVRLWSRRPAEIFNLPLNRFQKGDPADVAVFDPTAIWLVTPQTLLSKGKNTPCLGKSLPGKVKMMYVGGQRVV